MAPKIDPIPWVRPSWAELRTVASVAATPSPETILRALQAKKDELICGWVAYVALTAPDSGHASPEFMRATFGEWYHRLPEWREGRLWF